MWHDVRMIELGSGFSFVAEAGELGQKPADSLLPQNGRQTAGLPLGQPRAISWVTIPIISALFTDGITTVRLTALQDWLRQSYFTISKISCAFAVNLSYLSQLRN
jgi:hypothetical protein